MSQPTILRTSVRSARTTATKSREASIDRSILFRKSTVVENGTASSTNVKPKPPVKVIKKSSVSKTDSKSKPFKPENQRTNLTMSTTSDKLLSKTTKAPNAANKSSLLSHQATSVTKSKKLTAHETPPSSRVTKTQYFPTKKMYANVVQEHLKPKPEATKVSTADVAEVSGTERSKTRTLARNEIKIVKKKTPEVSSKPTEKVQASKGKDAKEKTTERPRTATLKRGSIVNSNIAGPNIPKSETPSLTSLDLSYEQETADQDAYEDDFDSYESDFEEYHSSEPSSLSSSSSSKDNHNVVLTGEITSSSEDDNSREIIPKQSTSAGTDEERMLDSGNFDMPENKHKQLLHNIKESNEQEHFACVNSENSRSNMASLSDEGFEEGKSSLQSGNMQFINFVGAQNKCKQNKNMEKRRKRGEEILNMIRLDTYNFTLIDIPSVSYDVFIKSYGQINTVQVPTQTGDDDTSEEIQTDLIETSNKWTQFPVTFSKINAANSQYLQIYKKEFIGVGDDYDALSQSTILQDNTNYKRLGKFLSYSSQIILTLLEESLDNNLQQIHQNSREIPFSKGYIKFEANSCEFLKNRAVSFVSYCSATNIQILTVHGRNKEAYQNEDDYLSLKSIVCIWSILNTNEPEKILVVTGELSVCCFVPEMKTLIFGGLFDGSVTTWDIGEDNWAQTLTDIGKKDKHIQEPSYTTDISCGHSSRVVAIQPLIKTDDNDLHKSFELKSPSHQICSLEETGTLIIWGVLTRNSSASNIFTVQTTLIPWSRISLVQNLKLTLKDFNPELKDLQCTEMSINLLDPYHLYVSCNYGYVVHCLVTGTKANPKKYNPGRAVQANCLEMCPFSPLYFFAGHEDGAIVLYSRLLEKPLIIMSNKDDVVQSGIQLLQWSYHKPCVFYAKDRCNTIHLWDLAISDLYPIYSIPFKENITCMKLSPPLANNNDTSYMILATETGSIHLHVLNTEFGPTSSRQHLQDTQKFLNYVSRL